MTNLPLIVTGTVTDSNGVILVTAQILFTFGDREAKVITDSNGQYVYDLNNLEASDGDTVSYEVTSKFNNSVLLGTTTASSTPGTLNFSLSERTDQVLPCSNRQTPLVTVGGQPVTSVNPLPVSSVDSSGRSTVKVTGPYEASDSDTATTTQYYGFLASDGSWYITKMTDNQKVIRYFKGSSNYPSNWANRTSLSYDYFSEVF